MFPICCAVVLQHSRLVRRVIPGNWLGPWVLCHALRATTECMINTHADVVVHVVCDPGGGAPMLYADR